MKIMCVFITSVIAVSGLAGCATVSGTPLSPYGNAKAGLRTIEKQEPVTPPPGYTLIWNDEFEGNEVNPEKWAFQEGTGAEYGLTRWGNNEAQNYRKENAGVSDGCLRITVKKEPYANMAYTSARLFTQPTFSFQYGRIEARIKLPAAEGLWPAFWMLPEGSEYGNWAASGEMDIMENKGRIMTETSGAAHYGGAWPNNVFSAKTYHFPAGSSAADFHVYALEWTDAELKWYVDGELFFTLSEWYTTDADGSPVQKGAPFDKKFYILLNCAVGGNFDSGITPPDSFEQAEMAVDYIRVFQRDADMLSR